MCSTIICKVPTKVSSGSATLIDNIFTNNIGDKISSGIFINDITNHFPIFVISERVNEKTQENNIDLSGISVVTM